MKFIVRFLEWFWFLAVLSTLAYIVWFMETVTEMQITLIAVLCLFVGPLIVWTIQYYLRPADTEKK